MFKVNIAHVTLCYVPCRLGYRRHPYILPLCGAGMQPGCHHRRQTETGLRILIRGTHNVYCMMHDSPAALRCLSKLLSCTDLVVMSTLQYERFEVVAAFSNTVFLVFVAIFGLIEGAHSVSKHEDHAYVPPLMYHKNATWRRFRVQSPLVSHKPTIVYHSDTSVYTALAAVGFFVDAAGILLFRAHAVLREPHQFAGADMLHFDDACMHACCGAVCSYGMVLLLV